MKNLLKMNNNICVRIFCLKNRKWWETFTSNSWKYLVWINEITKMAKDVYYLINFLQVSTLKFLFKSIKYDWSTFRKMTRYKFSILYKYSRIHRVIFYNINNIWIIFVCCVFWVILSFRKQCFCVCGDLLRFTTTFFFLQASIFYICLTNV